LGTAFFHNGTVKDLGGERKIGKGIGKDQPKAIKATILRGTWLSFFVSGAEYVESLGGALATSGGFQAILSASDEGGRRALKGHKD